MKVRPDQEADMANATTSRIDQDLDAQSPAADLVRVYLNGIGKTALLNAADEVELAKRIEAGLYAAAPARHPQAPGREPQAGSGRRGARRRGRAPASARSEPASGGVTGQALHRPRHAAAGPDPGRQPRADPRDGEVRLRQGLQVLHLRHLVDPSGDHPRHGRPEPHHPAARPPRRAGQQAGPDQARDAPEPRPRGHRRGAAPKSRASRSRRSTTCSSTAATR